MLPEPFEGHDFQGALVGGSQDNFRRVAGFRRLKPASGAEAPMVSRLEAGKIVVRHGGREVVAATLRKREEFGRDDNTDGVRPVILRACIAMPVAEKPRHRVETARLKRGAQDIARLFAAFSLRQIADSHGLTSRG